jgi:Tfp pilus assembly protein PilV
MAKNQLGQSLLEVIFAVAIVGMMLSGFVSAIVYFSKVGQVSESDSTATQLAQEKLEELRGMKKESADNFWQTMANYATATPTPENLHDGKFERSISVNYSQPDGTNSRARVDVTVSWMEQDQNKEITVKSYYSEY